LEAGERNRLWLDDAFGDGVAIAFRFVSDILFVMDEQATRPTPPELDEHDTAAVKAILMRVIRAQDEIARDREAIREANARMVANNLSNARAINALQFFGFQTVEGVNIWHTVREAIGDEAYDGAIDEARGIIPQLLPRMGISQGRAAITEQVAIGDTVEATVVRKPQVQIRTAILDYLRSVGVKGAKAAQVRQHLSDAYGITVHEKTPGMTLYRLSKDGLVKRKGRTWYAVEGKNENEAPNGNAAGASEAGGVAAPPNESVTAEELFR
jgi:hypothetical protein